MTPPHAPLESDSSATPSPHTAPESDPPATPSLHLQMKSFHIPHPGLALAVAFELPFAPDFPFGAPQVFELSLFQLMCIFLLVHLKCRLTYSFHHHLTMIPIVGEQGLSWLSFMGTRDVRRLSQTGESTGDRPAFLRFGSSSGYNNWNPNRFRIEFELQFLKVNRIPDHQSYIIDRVNLNVDRVGFS